VAKISRDIGIGEVPLFVRRSIDHAIKRIKMELDKTAPRLGQHVFDWMCKLAKSDYPATYFSDELMFPIMQLPWWFSRSVGSEVETGFHRDITYSSVNGYYFIRLIDNVADGHPRSEATLLPALAFFHTEFASVYNEYFAPDHVFWDFFKRAWFRTHEAALCGSFAQRFSPHEFLNISAEKLTAAHIPVCAAAWRANRSDLIPVWLDFCGQLARFFQMMDDLFDWNRDLLAGQGSYFLTEADLRRNDRETVHEWVLREGFQWGTEQLRCQLQDLLQTALDLQSPDAIAFIAHTRKQLTDTHEEIAKGLSRLLDAARLFSPSV
jgi:hypothetical protein